MYNRRMVPSDKKILKDILKTVQDLFILEALDEGVPRAKVAKFLKVERRRVSKVAGLNKLSRKKRS